jgi:hydroxymethylpyrimidine pyrophosphatase-like HAD family hydrolase
VPRTSTPDRRLTPAAIDATPRLGEAGVGFTIVSSRPPRGVAPIIQQLDIVLPFAGNATAEVKARAHVVAQTNENDGFAKAVNQCVLRRPAASMGGRT